jgi:hypothetical protein
MEQVSSVLLVTTNELWKKFHIILHWVTFQRLVFVYCLSEIHFVYLGNKKIECICKTCCIMCVLFFH